MYEPTLLSADRGQNRVFAVSKQVLLLRSSWKGNRMNIAIFAPLSMPRCLASRDILSGGGGGGG